MTLKVVRPGETFGALLAGEGLGGCLVFLVASKDMSSKVVLLRELLSALSAIKGSNLLVNGGNVLLKVILPSEPVLADVALPVPALLLLRLAVFAEGDDAHVVGHDIVSPCNGIA